MTVQPIKTDANNIALVSAQLATLPQLAQGTAVSASPHGTLRITPDPTSIFYDAFSGNTLDTVDRWTTTGTAPTQTNGLLSLPSGTASTTSILTSKPVLPITASQHIFPAFAVKVEAAVGTGVGRFWGLGTAPTTPSPTSLAQEGVGFELDSTTGALQAVTYTGGVKTLILALTRPTDGLMHRYSMQYRNSRTWWFIDDVNVYVATATFLNTAIQDLPLQVSSVSGATPTNAPSLILTAIGASDLNRQATQISDGIFPWRKATVSAAGALRVDVATLPVVADAAGSFTLAALNAVGALTTTGRATVNIELTGTWVGTVQFQATSDPSGVSAVAANWYPVNAVSPQLTALVQQTTTNGQFRLAAGGYTAVRAFMTAFTSGSAIAWVNASTAASVVSIIDPVTLAAGANTIGATNVNTANASATTALHTANVTTGLTVGSNLPVTGYGTSVLKVTGTFVASFAFKVSQDAGVSWDNISATQVGAGDIFTTATQPGSYRLTVAGFDLLRVEVTLTSGSITINGKSSNAVNAPKIVKLATGGLTIGTVNLSKAATAAVTAVSSIATAGTLLAANTARVGAVFFNDSSSLLYLKWGAAPTITSYTVKVLAGGYYELPGPIVYNGLITGLWATANGNLLVTEVTP